MPPRIHSSSCCQSRQLLNYLEAAPPISISASPLALQRLAATSTSSSSQLQCSRSFSTTPVTEARQPTRQRREFLKWINDYKEKFRTQPNNGKTNYISQLVTVSDYQDVYEDQPFPNNPNFRSEPVLSSKARHMIWKDVMREGLPLKAVSAKYQVDMRRVAAVVRMKQIEHYMYKKKMPLARTYHDVIMSMLPRAYLTPGEKPFEPINDIHVHSYTMQQLFVPTAESREFTRADAAKAFGEHILPPDEKMRIPELVEMERNIASGMEPEKAYAIFKETAAQSERAFAEAQKAKAKHQADKTLRVDNGRFEFRFEKVNADDVGRNGRSRTAVGWRYGQPFTDRRRGEVKIPTKVE